MEEKNFAKGAYIIIEGEKNTGEFFIVRKGQVRVYRKQKVEGCGDDDILLPGEVFGIPASMAGPEHCHVETVRAMTDVSLIVVHRDSFEKLIQSNTSVALKIMLQFAKRTRVYNDALAKKLARKTDAATATPISMQTSADEFSPANFQFAKSVDDSLIRAYPKGSVIITEGEMDKEIFIIKSGLVKIVKKTATGGEAILSILKAGDIFGEIAPLSDAKRTASAIACEDCLIIAANFERMIKTQPQIIAMLATSQAQRICNLYGKLVSASISDPTARLYGALLLELNKLPQDTQSFTFNFGVEELCGMAGLAPNENVGSHLEKILHNKHIGIKDDKISVQNVGALKKQAAEYHNSALLKHERQRERCTN